MLGRNNQDIDCLELLRKFKHKRTLDELLNLGAFAVTDDDLAHIVILDKLNDRICRFALKRRGWNSQSFT